MTPDANSTKTTPPTPAKNPLSNPGDRNPTPPSRPPMAPVPKPILPVAVPDPAKLRKDDGSNCHSSASPAKSPSSAPLQRRSPAVNQRSRRSLFRIVRYQSPPKREPRRFESGSGTPTAGANLPARSPGEREVRVSEAFGLPESSSNVEPHAFASGSGSQSRSSEHGSLSRSAGGSARRSLEAGDPGPAPGRRCARGRFGGSSRGSSRLLTTRPSRGPKTGRKALELSRDRREHDSG
jgi:hypothetical protein